jgi:Na+/proline symporter
MSQIDWAILIGTLSFIVLYGSWKSRGSKNVNDFLLGGKEARWWTVGLSVMATQASAITFLSTPGQAYHDGMGFVQFYFGLPLAMIVICVTFIPIYHRLKVYTAYEYLETRFDLKTRSLTSILFLVQRGLAAGITIYAPAIILSSIMGWNLNWTNILIGSMVIIYTVSGGTKAVNVTHKWQMAVIMTGMITAFIIIINQLPEDLSFVDALHVAGASGKMEVLDFSFDASSRYNIWSGVLGGFFLSLSYFGTDQSQVQRYLAGKSVNQSRIGLLMNGLIKIPMQFFILLVGVMVFVLFQFEKTPIFFNTPVNEQVYESEYKEEFQSIESQYSGLMDQKSLLNLDYAAAKKNDQDPLIETLRFKISELNDQEMELRNQAKEIISKVDSSIELNDKDYVFIHYILNFLPIGLIGLLLAVIFSAAMSSTAAELNALASTTTMDIYKRSIVPDKSEKHYLRASKLLTIFWGVVAILFASIGTLFENLIQFVNIIGSVFYGTILGIFLVAFYVKYVKSNAVFIAAVISQISVITVYKMDTVGYLWLNLIGCFAVIFLSILIQFMKGNK